MARLPCLLPTLSHTVDQEEGPIATTCYMLALLDLVPSAHTFSHTADQEEGPIATICYMLGAEPITSLVGSELHTKGAALIFLNGNLLGVHRRPHKLVQAIRCTWGRG